jgi:probable HAF family extracellular repeat protein
MWTFQQRRMQMRNALWSMVVVGIVGVLLVSGLVVAGAEEKDKEDDHRGGRPQCLAELTKTKDELEECRDTALLYQITDLGVLPGGSTSNASSLNANGQVVGGSDSKDGFRAFLWTPSTPNGTSGTMVNLGTLPGDIQSFALDINASGQVVGDSNAGPPFAHGFLYTDGIMINLGSQPGATFTDANGINAVGQVVGESNNAFLWTPTTPHDLVGAFTSLGTLPGGGQSAALRINDRGQVVGWAFSFGTFRAFLWSPTSPNATTGSMIDLGVLPGGSQAQAKDINTSGQVVGWSTISADLIHPFLWTPTTPNGHIGAFIDLSVLPGNTQGQALGLNDHGHVVGLSYGGNGNRAFLYRDGLLIDLNSLLINSSGWQLTVASAINNVGQIVGSGEFQGHQRAFLATPVRNGEQQFRECLEDCGEDLRDCVHSCQGGERTCLKACLSIFRECVEGCLP